MKGDEGGAEEQEAGGHFVVHPHGHRVNDHILGGPKQPLHLAVDIQKLPSICHSVSKSGLLV